MADVAAGEADAAPHMEFADPPDPPLEGIDYDLPEFEMGLWEPLAFQYGIIGLLRCRQVMMPIEKPTEMVHLKFVHGLSPVFDDQADLEPPEFAEAQPRSGGDRKGRGKGKEKTQKGGRYVPDMGRTEVIPNWQKGQWWRNVAEDMLDVIVREQFSLASPQIWKAPHGHYVQQAGPCEVFVSGQATGLQRMPVYPRGWATVDATAVGGPKYLEKVGLPRWKIVFSSGSNKGDIVVRKGVSLESDEVAVLLCGTCVEQSGPQQVLDDGIIRMPIVFGEGLARGPSSLAQQPGCRTGWVTCDATAQGGPKFFESCPEEVEPPPVQPRAQPQAVPPEDELRSALAASGGPSHVDRGAGSSSWDKNRTWKVVNLGVGPSGRQLPMVKRPEPFTPGGSKAPPEDMILRWLHDGDLVEQIGHSKKMRGYMVMPVRVISAAAGDVADPALGEDADKEEGWVTRRSLDKSRDQGDISWFEEVRGADDGDFRQRRRSRRHNQDAQGLD